MSHTRTATALTAALLLTACSSQPTYDESVQACTKAVKALPAGTQVRPRPKACERVTDQDYNIIFSSKVMDDAGWPTLPPTPNP
jgi:hypothetical protein